MRPLVLVLALWGCLKSPVSEEKVLAPCGSPGQEKVGLSDFERTEEAVEDGSNMFQIEKQTDSGCSI